MVRVEIDRALSRNPGHNGGAVAMKPSGRIRRRLALAIVLTALIPVLVAIFLAQSMVRQTGARFFVPEVGARLDQSLGLYQELARAVKASMRHAGSAIAADTALRKAVKKKDRQGVKKRLDHFMKAYPNIVSLSVFDDEGSIIARSSRKKKLDPKKENKLEVHRALGEAQEDNEEPEASSLDPPQDEVEFGEDEPSDSRPRLLAVFSANKARFDELDEMSQFVDTYKKIEARRRTDEASYVYAFAALLGITIVAAVGVGTLLARRVSSRLGALAEATKQVAAGDLKTRVPESGKDEISELAVAFNRMLAEVETSRARIEYLKRIGAWQEMARRLAHEIKNPLTPIQLAVQEAHRRCPDDDPSYRRLLDTTLEIVEDEVGTLRRLVSEFSGFARLPRAHLVQEDLADFLREQEKRILLLESDSADEEGAALTKGVSLRFEIPDRPAPVYIDRQMLRRAIINLVRNAAQAVASSERPGEVVVTLREQLDLFIVDIDDSGPGIDEELLDTVFDPYVTTKTDGTGLGLAIVKKIVVEHGGTIVAGSSPLGGARMRFSVPRGDSERAAAVLNASAWQSSSRNLKLKGVVD